MMRLWKDSHARRSSPFGAAAASTLAHAAIVGAWIAATLPSASLPRDSLANRIFYIPPPDKPPVVFGSAPAVRYITLADGMGVGSGPPVVDSRSASSSSERVNPAAGRSMDTVSAPPGNSAKAMDSVFTILEVDTAVARSANSAAPAYPLDLLQAKIEGMVRVRYVVDTTGFADPASLEIVESTNAGFTSAVRDVLPYMRFSPAKIGDKKVRQLVEQPFSFHITQAAPSKPGKPATR